MTISTELEGSLSLEALDGVNDATVISLDSVALGIFDVGTSFESRRCVELRSFVTSSMELKESSSLQWLLGVAGVTKGAVDGVSIWVLEEVPTSFE